MSAIIVATCLIFNGAFFITFFVAALAEREPAWALPLTFDSLAIRVFFIDLALSDASGHLLSRNFYWVPGTLTAFDWDRSNYTHAPAARHEDMSALTSLPTAKVGARAEIENTPQGRELRLHLQNRSAALAFQLHAALRSGSGELIAPVIWSDNWIELTPGESRTLTAQLPASLDNLPVVQLEGWNVLPQTIGPTVSNGKSQQDR